MGAIGDTTTTDQQQAEENLAATVAAEGQANAAANAAAPGTTAPTLSVPSQITDPWTGGSLLIPTPYYVPGTTQDPVTRLGALIGALGRQEAQAVQAPAAPGHLPGQLPGGGGLDTGVARFAGGIIHAFGGAIDAASNAIEPSPTHSAQENLASEKADAATAKADKGRNATVAQIKTALAQIGVNVPKDITTAAEIRQMKLPAVALQELQSMGYDTKGMVSVANLAATAPPAARAAVNNPATTGQQAYDQLLQAYSQNPGQVYQTLVNAGYIDTAGSNAKSDQTIASAMQQLVTDASNNKRSVAQQLSASYGSNQNLQIGEPNLSYVQTLAASYGVKNNLTPEEMNFLASEVNASSSGSVGAESSDAIRQSMLKAVTFDPSNPPTTGYAGAAYKALQDTFGQWGVTPSSTQLAQMTMEVLNDMPSATGSVYSAQDLAADYAEQAAKQQASTLYPSIAPQINQGMTVQSILSPYMSEAEKYLGVNAASISPTNPLVTAALKSAETPGAPMSMDEYDRHLMAQPGFQTSQTARNRAADLGMAVRDMLGLQGPSAAGGAVNQYSPNSDVANG